MASEVIGKWTPKATKIYDLLQQAVTPAAIKKEVKTSFSYITKIKNAIANGEHPTLGVNKPNFTQPPPQPSPLTPSQVSSSEQKKEEEKETVLQMPVGTEAMIGRVVPLPVIIPLTPVMYSAKAYLIERKGWSPDVKWEDIIDTVFHVYFRSIGVVLRGWYEESPIVSPKPAGENGEAKEKGSASKKDKESDKFKELADMVTLQIIELANQNKLGGK